MIMILDDVVAGNWVIDENGVVNVNGSVMLENLGLTEIPWRFGTVTGSFRVDGNKLTSLKNCPWSVGFSFTCHKNQLKSLKYCPIYVGQNFACHKNQLESLEHSPINIGGRFCCQFNRLTSLEYCSVSTKIICYDNPIKTFKDIPFEIISKIDCIQKYFDKKIIAIPQEYAEDFAIFMERRKKYKPRKVSVKERLESI